MWQSGRAGSPSASRACTSGRSSNGDAGEQRVEGRVAQQVERQRQPVRGGAAAPARRGDRADLAGADRQPAGVEGAAERQRDLAVAVPAQVEDGALRRRAGRGSAGARATVALACTTRSQPPGASRGQREADAERRRRPRRARRRRRRASPGRPGSGRAAGRRSSRPSGADDGDPVAEQRRGVPERRSPPSPRCRRAPRAPGARRRARR